MRNVIPRFYKSENVRLRYYEVENDLPPLLMIHGQGVDGMTFSEVFDRLSQRYHIYSVDCFGHGDSLHDAERYNIKDTSEAIIELIRGVIKGRPAIVGHSSGGLIAAYIAAETDLCSRLFLEDPPFFSCQGERRKQTYNYVDLSSVCHSFLNQQEETDFVLYYFANQYMWNFFPEKSREKTRAKMVKMAAKFRRKHPDEDLKVLFWPENALSGFRGMNNYDPLFGEAFYDDSFHAGIPHEELLKKIACRTVLMKAKTETGEDGLLMGALSDEDAERAAGLISICEIRQFDCGHGIHVEKPKQFIDCLTER